MRAEIPPAAVISPSNLLRGLHHMRISVTSLHQQWGNSRAITVIEIWGCKIASRMAIEYRVVIGVRGRRIIEPIHQVRLAWTICSLQADWDARDPVP